MREVFGEEPQGIMADGVESAARGGALGQEHVEKRMAEFGSAKASLEKQALEERETCRMQRKALGRLNEELRRMKAEAPRDQRAQLDKPEVAEAYVEETRIGRLRSWLQGLVTLRPVLGLFHRSFPAAARPLSLMCTAIRAAASNSSQPSTTIICLSSSSSADAPTEDKKLEYILDAFIERNRLPSPMAAAASDSDVGSQDHVDYNYQPSPDDVSSQQQQVLGDVEMGGESSEPGSEHLTQLSASGVQEDFKQPVQPLHFQSPFAILAGAQTQTSSQVPRGIIGAKRKLYSIQDPGVWNMIASSEETQYACVHIADLQLHSGGEPLLIYVLSRYGSYDFQHEIHSTSMASTSRFLNIDFTDSYGMHLATASMAANAADKYSHLFKPSNWLCIQHYKVRAKNPKYHLGLHRLSVDISMATHVRAWPEKAPPVLDFVRPSDIVPLSHFAVDASAYTSSTVAAAITGVDQTPNTTNIIFIADDPEAENTYKVFVIF
ncbi:hypothetical protein SELMODRAFT_420052 [Selaginella moellendorffii]|uniref:Uncharacterized protein n=1 Tax=Selaginella moellendorffii TaxID=88036 RepID=D8SAE0_SELML|nr:hypothetical protein SELMODRAFT_420052 [Selaginella moellendorffii]